MKTFFLVLMLMISSVASAEHHRQHAVGFLDQIEYFLVGTEQNLDYYFSDFGPMDDNQQYRHDSLYYQIASIRNYIDYMRWALNNPDIPLDTVRRKSNMPNTSAPNSLQWRIATLGYQVTFFIDQHPNGKEVWISRSQRNLFVILRIAQNANWHINDAIREEIYQDPVFICSGPNNHCE